MDLLELYNEIIYEPKVKVICYTCGSHIYNIDKVPVGHTVLSSSMFIPVRKNTEPPRPGEKVVCPICGGPFLLPGNELLIEKIE